jgi:hypothetical protein
LEQINFGAEDALRVLQQAIDRKTEIPVWTDCRNRTASGSCVFFPRRESLKFSPMSFSRPSRSSNS